MTKISLQRHHLSLEVDTFGRNPLIHFDLVFLYLECSLKLAAFADDSHELIILLPQLLPKKLEFTSHVESSTHLTVLITKSTILRNHFHKNHFPLLRSAGTLDFQDKS